MFGAVEDVYRDTQGMGMMETQIYLDSLGNDPAVH